MGLYDYLHHEGQTYQTKDTPLQSLHNYYIENGRLLEASGHIEDRGDKTPGADILLRVKGMCTFIETGKVDLNFHGYLWFCDGGADYKAKFTDGQLMEITRFPDPT